MHNNEKDRGPQTNLFGLETGGEKVPADLGSNIFANILDPDPLCCVVI